MRICHCSQYSAELPATQSRHIKINPHRDCARMRYYSARSIRVENARYLRISHILNSLGVQRVFGKEVLTAITHQIIHAYRLIRTAKSGLFFRMCRIRDSRPSARTKLINVRIRIQRMSDLFGIGFHLLGGNAPVTGFFLSHRSPTTAVERIIGSNGLYISPVPRAGVRRIASYPLRFGILRPLLGGFCLCNPLHLLRCKRHFDGRCPTLPLLHCRCTTPITHQSLRAGRRAALLESLSRLAALCRARPSASKSCPALFGRTA